MNFKQLEVIIYLKIWMFENFLEFPIIHGETVLNIFMFAYDSTKFSWKLSKTSEDWY